MSPAIQRVTYSRGSMPMIQLVRSQILSKMNPKETLGSDAASLDGPGHREHRRQVVEAGADQPVVGDGPPDAEVLGDPRVGQRVVAHDALDAPPGRAEPLAVGGEGVGEDRDQPLVVEGDQLEDHPEVAVGDVGGQVVRQPVAVGAGPAHLLRPAGQVGELCGENGHRVPHRRAGREARRGSATRPGYRSNHAHPTEPARRGICEGERSRRR